MATFVVPATASALSYDINWNTIIGTTNRQRMIQIAQSQVGYFETTGSDGISGSQVKTTSAPDPHTAYNKYTQTKTAWCAWFLSWCARQAGISTDVIKKTGSVATMMSGSTYSKYYAQGNYSPQVGDLIVFDWNANSSADHVELISAVNTSSYTTVGGSSSAVVSGAKYYYGVGTHTYSKTSGYVMGFIAVDYETTGVTVTPPPATPTPTAPATNTTTKTQYRYHRYIDSAGNISVCPYYGGWKYNSTMTIQYTDWLDAPLTVNNGSYSCYTHVRQSQCAGKGCIDVSCDTNRVEYNGTYYFYQETRTVTVETPVVKKTHTVYLNANGGTAGTSQITVTENAAYGNLPIPLLNNYTFDGWYTSAVGGTQISSATVFSSTSDQTLYAHWTKQDLSSFENFSYSKNWTGSQFSDIPTGEWYYSNVKTAYQLGLMNGVGSGSFSPKANVTIAEAITLAARLHNIYYNGVDSFTTYDSGNWYDTYVDYAKENGIISGNYDMNATATRGQFAQILAAAFQDDKALAVIRNIDYSKIPDLSGTESYASAVLRMYRAGVLTGSDSKGTFNAGSTISRAEVATIVTRMAVIGLRVTG